MILMEWFLKGGLFMWPLLAGSLVGLAVIAERGWLHWSIRLDYPQFLKRLKAELSGCPLRAPDWLREARSPIARIAAVHLRYIHAAPNVRNEAIKREGNRMLAALDLRLKLLSSIAHVTPLLGLLGTVAGLVSAFYQIEATGGQVNPTDLAGGIWEALLTTVAGLSIGIPCLLMHQFYHARVEGVARAMQETISELDEMLAVGRLQPRDPDKPGASAFEVEEEPSPDNDPYEVI